MSLATSRDLKCTRSRDESADFESFKTRWLCVRSAFVAPPAVLLNPTSEQDASNLGRQLLYENAVAHAKPPRRKEILQYSSSASFRLFRFA